MEQVVARRPVDQRAAHHEPRITGRRCFRANDSIWRAFTPGRSLPKEATRSRAPAFRYAPRASRLRATAFSYSPPVIRTTLLRKPAAAFAWTSGFDAVGSIRGTTASMGTAGSHSSTSESNTPLDESPRYASASDGVQS